MSDYIKREDAINELCNNCTVGTIEYGECRYMFNGECKEARGIKDLPSADVVERKSGKWIKETTIGLGVEHYHGWRCSECGEHCYPKSNFCPNCGSDNRGGNNNE